MILLLFIYILLIPNVLSVSNVYCSQHDACKNYAISNSANIFCGGGERTCKNIFMKCDTNSCLVQTQGGGHDAFQNSIIDARLVSSNNKFELKCEASGLRDCTNNIIWCPLSAAKCSCINCPSSVTIKCLQGNSNCNSITSGRKEFYTLSSPTTIAPTTIAPTTIAPTTTIKLTTMPSFLYIYRQKGSIKKQTVIIPINNPNLIHNLLRGSSKSSFRIVASIKTAAATPNI